MERKAYFMMGHGGDTGNFDSRIKVPKGFTFVTNSTCGLTIFGKDMTKKVKVLQELGEDVYTNPMKHKDKLKDLDLHIFNPGDLLPDMSYSFGEEFKNIIKDDTTKYITKDTLGIFPFPYTEDTLFVYSNRVKTKNNYEKYKKEEMFTPNDITNENIKEIITKLFLNENNILKNDFLAKLPGIFDKAYKEYKFHSKIAKKRMIDVFFKNLKIQYTIQDLIKILKPGVYYFLVCRYNPTINNRIQKTRRLSLNQQTMFNITRKLHELRAPNHVPIEMPAVSNFKIPNINFRSNENFLEKKKPTVKLIRKERTVSDASSVSASPIDDPSIRTESNASSVISATPINDPSIRTESNASVISAINYPPIRTESNASSVSANDDSETENEKSMTSSKLIGVKKPKSLHEFKRTVPKTTPSTSSSFMPGRKPQPLTRKKRNISEFSGVSENQTGGGDQYYRKDGPDYYVCFHKSGNCFPLDESENIQKAKAYLKAKENASRPNPALLNRSTRVAHMTRNMKHYNGPRGYNGASGVKNFGGKRRHTRKQRKA